MIDTTFCYEVKIAGESELLTDGGLFSDLLENCAEVIIHSDIFHEYKDCAETLNKLLVVFSNIMSDSSGKSYVIMSRLNPQVDPNAVKIKNDNEKWDKRTVSRIYIADADKLKSNKELLFTISADIKIDSSNFEKLQLLASKEFS